MLHELGLVSSDSEPWKMGFINFLTFIICGMLPIIPYIIANSLNSEVNMLLPAIFIGFAGLISLGVIKAKVINFKGFLLVKTVLEIVMMGSVVVAICYGIGFIFK
jgi:VIT1/CCC1 family predicted Fe2+/Mn2+ transporter